MAEMDLEKFVEAEGRNDKIKEVRKMIDELGIEYLYLQFVSITGKINVVAEEINASFADSASLTLKALSSIFSFSFLATSNMVCLVIPGNNLLDKFLVIIVLFLSII